MRTLAAAVASAPISLLARLLVGVLALASIGLQACGSGTSAARGAASPIEPSSASAAIDRCPEEDEDLDAFEDEDGCLDPDNDGDGILDVNDLCPCSVEDGDGFEDADGCPDGDDDDDRIPDACDRCPRDAERYNGTCDEDGCPDRGPVLLIDCQIRILERIGFARGSARIRAEDGPRLDAIAATLAGNPQLERLAIVGHAQLGERPAARLTDLASARAAAVESALVARGVVASRLGTEIAAPASGQGVPYEERYVGFVITQWEGESWVNGERPGGCGASEPPHPSEPATCDPLPACTFVEEDACAPRPGAPDAPTPR